MSKPVVALLRGVNVGGHRRLPMADLRAALEEAGYEDVRTLLQSGNVVLRSDRKADAVGSGVARVIADGFGHDVHVVTRTGAQLAKIVESDPFADDATDGAKHFVAFQSKPAAKASLDALAAKDLAPDAYEVRGKEIYTWCPEGMRDSELMRMLSTVKLFPTATVRNWNTVTKLLEMVRA